MLGGFPTEILSILTYFLNLDDVLSLCTTGDKILINRLKNSRGYEDLVCQSTNTSRESEKRHPKSVSSFRYLRSIDLGYTYNTQSNKLNWTPSYDWIHQMPPTLTRLAYKGKNVLNPFFSPNMASISAQRLGTAASLVQWSNQIKKGVHFYPWIPLRSVLPNLRFFEIFEVTPLSQTKCDVGVAIHLFIVQLPPNLQVLHSNCIFSAQGKWAAALPRYLESWSSPSLNSGMYGWAPTIDKDSQGNTMPNPSNISNLKSFGLLASQVALLPNTLREITLMSSVEVNSLAHFPNLTALRCRNLTKPASTDSGLSIFSYLPKSLQHLRVHYAIEFDARETFPTPLFPSQIQSLELHVLTLTGLERNLLLHLPSDLTSLICSKMPQKNLPPTWPVNLTRLEALFDGLPLQDLAKFPPTLRYFDISGRFSVTDLGSEPKNPLLDLTFLRGLIVLRVSGIRLEITNSFLLSMPVIQTLELDEATIHESCIPYKSKSSILSLSVAIVIASGRGISEEGFFSPDSYWDGVMTHGAFVSAFHDWLIKSGRVNINSTRVEVELERLPEGTTALKNMKWKTSKLEFLPSTLTELSGSFVLNHNDISRLPKYLKTIQDDNIYVVDDKATSTILERLTSSDRLAVFFPSTIFESMFIGTDIRPLEPHYERGGTLTLTDDTLAKLWPELQSLVFSTSFPLLTPSCAQHIPKRLTRLMVTDYTTSLILWAAVQGLTVLDELVIFPRPGNVDEDFKSLPASLKILRLLNDQTTASQSDIHIPLSSVGHLPQALSELSIAWTNDLADDSVQFLPRSLRILHLESPNIQDPPFHHFPITLVSVTIPSIPDPRRLLQYLSKKRKAQ